MLHSRHGGSAAKRPAVVYDIEGGIDQASIPADDFSGVVLNNVLQLKHGSTRGARTCVWNPAQSDSVRKCLAQFSTSYVHIPCSDNEVVAPDFLIEVPGHPVKVFFTVRLCRAIILSAL